MHLCKILQVLPLALFAAAIPHDIVPKHQLGKRTLPPLDIFPSDPTSQQHKNALSEALSDTLLLVQQVSLSYPGDDGSGPYADIWSKYFPPADHKKVQGVWNKIMSDPKNPGQGEDIVRTAVIVGTDLVKQQLNVELCDGNLEAYTNPFPPGFDPGLPTTATFTFFCDPAFALPARYGDITCAKVGDTLSANMEFLGGTILHEWMHNDGIGAQGTGGAHIGDYSTPQDSRAGYGPYKTRQLLINNPSQCIVNADSYLYLAYEIIFTKACLGGTNRFKDPVPDTSVVSAPPSIPGSFTFSGTLTDSPAPIATVPPFVSATVNSPPPTITCEHAADPDGAMGLCPNLANGGWCDCGSAGTFTTETGGNICGYTAVPSTGSIALTSTNCISTPAVQVLTATVIPLPASTGS